MIYIKCFESFDKLKSEFGEDFLSQFQIEEEGKWFYLKFHKYFNRFKSLERVRQYLRLKNYVYNESDLKYFKKLINSPSTNLYEDDNWLIKKLVIFDKTDELELMLSMKGVDKKLFVPNRGDKENLLSKCRSDKAFYLIDKIINNI